MIKIRQSRGFAAMVVGAMAVAWFFASMHCGLAAVQNTEKPDPEHGCCHSDQGTSRPWPVQCCEALAAPVPQKMAAPGLHLHELAPVWLPTFDVEVEAAVAPVVIPSDTGPPQGSASFAELVLNRSLLAHAPPRLVA